MFDNLIETIQSFFDSANGLNIHDVVPDDSTINDFINALDASGIDLSQYSHSEIVDAVQSAFVGHNAISHNDLSFKGFTAIEPLADLQKGPTCGFEAVENFIQLGNPNCSNTLSDYLQKTELIDGGSCVADGGYSLDPSHYQHILNSFSIPTKWYDYSLDKLVNFIDNNHGVLAVGDAHYLDPISYPLKGSYHAFMITDIVKNTNGDIFKFKGIDSNFDNQETLWSPAALEKALQSGPLKQSLLVSLNELKWPYKTT